MYEKIGFNRIGEQRRLIMKTIFKVSIVILILSSIVFQYDWMHGNSISKHMSAQQIEMFLLKNAKGKEYEISKITKSIKQGGYYWAEVKEKGQDKVFNVTATETSVVYHDITGVPPLKRTEPPHYSTEIMKKVVKYSFISVLISGVWIFVRWISYKRLISKKVL